MTSRDRGLVVLVTMLALTLGCKSAPSQRPLGMGPVDTGPGSVEAVRRELQGSWILDRFETIDAAGQPHAVKAQATLTYDQFGNMSVAGRLLEAVAGQPSSSTDNMLHYSGRVVIDTEKHEFRLQSPEGATDPALESTVGLNFVRKYEINNDRLTITYIDPQGKTTARTVFRRQ